MFLLIARYRKMSVYLVCVWLICNVTCLCSLFCIQLQVKVNGEDFLEYEQKLSMKSINCIRIENDVKLYKVKLV